MVELLRAHAYRNVRRTARTSILCKRKLGHAGECEEKDKVFGFDLQGDSPVLNEVHSFESFLSASNDLPSWDPLTLKSN